ncbi:hypothetical protein RA086_03660 [Lactiplantibacillus sp. WILCCON 0030]|uniref:Uncharacterized protein n=1 Tax=Lactiplantibacillus brownii TaxID=3069269 RepID=A0ABU1A738_9LACO|nr:hypothetical protein [Lactiplantibacillus brownii]MDQ7936743.1 hypothetical protein [Lactiplantibacillus brownii]
MSKLATPAEINTILEQIKGMTSQWRLSPRPKNIELLQELGLSKEDVFAEITKMITWQDYLTGPERDNHRVAIPGEIWVFGTVLYQLPCYLKFQNRPTGVIVWISIHRAK